MTLQRILAATDGEPIHRQALPERFRICTDTRLLERGDTFLALRGDRFDGHAFVMQALHAGASAVIVDDRSVLPHGAAAIVVGDTKAAYLALAAAARRQLRAPVVAITGSTGKTTTKAFLTQILERSGAGNILATPANENNELGVSKLLLGASDDADVLVIEFGARHYGDIATLVSIARPDIAVLTNVGDAHLEVMGSPERLAETKWSIFSGGALPVLNADDAVSRKRAPSLSIAPRWFGIVSAGATLPSAPPEGTFLRGRDELVVVASQRRHSFPVRCTVPGEHNRANVAAACAAALRLGIEPARVANAIERLELPAGRYERTRLGDLELIFDAYNASMAGTLATLDTFAGERADRRIAVLSSMAELGDGAVQMHERVGAAAAHSNLAALLVGGDHACDLERGARGAGIDAERLVRFTNNQEAVRWLHRNARAGDVVLLKGSRRYHLEEIVAGLTEAQPSP
ncbi:MAG: UDP-N-acetylmuramoyl-tripeptide--D-alanyl-D-alanine ligase [Candidatus Eremiobacteraeota bacterium]|nr:UDP-N-acetylmuramoyl-tripeptide--D-alanyl-D-alanine ligase [Candidatus Eremiobacteraeota bacterium]MBV9647098.1 UDP-N-acetylmuramoyl-tripeptide--D-alanyl-D-alanine ligase [Candidatus Eremiobacteraeota bacterium]